MSDDVMRAKEAAEYLGIHPVTLYRKAETGEGFGR
jgi:excisionase family DNA binding protein